jgi:hypothetical protein
VVQICNNNNNNSICVSNCVTIYSYLCFARNIRPFGDEIHAPFVRETRSEIIRASAGDGRDGVLHLAWKCVYTFLGTKSAFLELGLQGGYATYAATALAAAEITYVE